MLVPLIANFCALVGSAIALIPMGMVFEKAMTTEWAWAFLFAIQKLPGVVAAPILASSADRLGTSRSIHYSLIFATIIFAGLTIISGKEASSVLFVLILFTVFRGFFSAVESLFPAMLVRADSNSARLLGNWQIILSFASICSVLLGGLLIDNLSHQNVFYFCTFLLLLSTLIWTNFRFRNPGVAEPNSIVPLQGLSSSLKLFMSSPLLKAISVRAVAFGIVNPIIPVTLQKQGFSGGLPLGLVIFLLGLSAIMGAQIAKQLNFKMKAAPALVAFEIASLGLAITTQSLIVFVAALAVAGLINSTLEVHLLRHFLKEHSDQTNFASATYKMFYSLFLVLGYFAAIAVVPLPLIGQAALFLFLVGSAHFFLLRIRLSHAH